MTSLVSSVSVPSASSDKQVSKTQEPPKILLPEDLFAIAFSYLPLNDIMAASLVSRYINKCIPACTEIQIPEQMSVESGLLTSRLAEKFRPRVASRAASFRVSTRHLDTLIRVSCTRSCF